jgi:hypothetical protein
MQDRAHCGSQGSILQDSFYNEGRKTMIVTRLTFNVKQGRMQEAAEHVAKEIAAERERSGYAGRTRVYTSSIGQFNQLVIEWEYENLAEHENFWAEWRARPTTPAFFEKWAEMTVGTGKNEIWDLQE